MNLLTLIFLAMSITIASSSTLIDASTNGESDKTELAERNPQEQRKLTCGLSVFTTIITIKTFRAFYKKNQIDIN